MVCPSQDVESRNSPRVAEINHKGSVLKTGSLFLWRKNMNALQVFENEQFNVRTIVDDNGEILFVAKDKR